MATPPPPDADEWQRNYQQKLAEAERRNEEMTEQVNNIEATERSSDRQISVTVNNQGNLTGLELGNSLRQRGGQEVSAEVLQLVGTAQGRVAEQVREAMEPYIGGSAAMDHLVTGIRSAPETSEESGGTSSGSNTRPRFDDEDDDWGDNDTFLR